MKGNHGTLMPVSPNQLMVFELSSGIILNSNDDEIRASIKNRGSGYSPKIFQQSGESHLIRLLRRLHEKQREEATS